MARLWTELGIANRSNVFEAALFEKKLMAQECVAKGGFNLRGAPICVCSGASRDVSPKVVL